MKIVRNKIPEIIEKSGSTCKHRIANDQEVDQLLREKLIEECDEFFEEPSLMEAADMYEVFLTILDNWGIEFSDVVNHSYYKREARGSFSKRIVLLSVDDKEIGSR